MIHQYINIMSNQYHKVVQEGNPLQSTFNYSTFQVFLKEMFNWHRQGHRWIIWRSKQ